MLAAEYSCLNKINNVSKLCISVYMYLHIYTCTLSVFYISNDLLYMHACAIVNVTDMTDLLVAGFCFCTWNKPEHFVSACVEASSLHAR